VDTLRIRDGVSRVGLRALEVDWTISAAAAFAALVVVAAVLGEIVTPHDPYTPQIALRNRPPGFLVGGQPPFFLGTDALGRDVLSRLIVGARVSLAVAGSSVLISGVAGMALGLIAGWYRGRIETVIMGLVDLQMSLPSLLVALFVLFIIGGGFLNVILVFAVTRWMIYARVARAMTLSVREQPFVEAARSLGASDIRVMLRHLLPSIRNPMLAVATLEIPMMLLSESALSFLGLGIQPPGISWGLMLGQGRAYLTSAWWVVTFPGLALLATAVAFNLLGTAAAQRAGQPASTIERLRRAPRDAASA
jgi:peptide/nickel transport system permease protein